MGFLRATVWLAILLSFSGESSWSAEDTAWKDVIGFLFKEAGESFTRDDGKMPPRERKLGEGLILLNSQPRSQENLHRAVALFQNVAAEDPSDSFGLIARLSEARAWESHLAQKDKSRAREIYVGLTKATPGHPICELATTRLVILDMFEDVPAETLNERARTLTALQDKLHTPEGKAMFHYTLGLSLIELNGDPDLALFHLKNAFELGMKDWQNQARLLVALGAVSEMLGEWQIAETAYSAFVDAYRRDKRTTTIKARLESVRAKQQKRNG